MMATSSSSRTTPMVADRKEFERLIAEEKWDRLIWLRYTHAHTEEVALLFQALNTGKDRLVDWIKNYETRVEDSGTRTRVDVVVRFVDFITLVPAFIFHSHLFDSEKVHDAIEEMSASLRVLQHTLIHNEFIMELDAYRTCLCECLRQTLVNGDELVRLRSTAVFRPCLSYVADNVPYETYVHITNMYGRDKATRLRFLSRCRQECETLVLFAEVLSGAHDAAALTVGIYPSLIAISSILMASRLSPPCIYNETLLAPLPVEWSSEPQDWFKRLFRLCWECKVFNSLTMVCTSLADPLRKLPEFWFSSQGLPLSKFVELMWDELARDNDHWAKVDIDIVRQTYNALRLIAYAARYDSSIIARIESWLASKLSPATLASAIDSSSEDVMMVSQKRLPALALLISKVLEVSTAYRNSFDDDPEVIAKTHNMRMELFQSVRLIATTIIPEYQLLYEAMTVCACGALRSLGDYVAASMADAASIQDRKRVDSGETYASIVVEIRAVLNLLQHILLHNEIRARLLPVDLSSSLSFVSTMFEATKFAGDFDRLDAAKPIIASVHQTLASQWPQLCRYSTKSSALCILVGLLSEGEDNVVALDPVMVVILFDSCLESRPRVEEASLALLALARAVENFRANWAELQRLIQGCKVTLSNICGRVCSDAWQSNVHDLRWLSEAMATFQYMTLDPGDDDGNRELCELEDLKTGSVLTWTPVGICIDLALPLLESVARAEDNIETIECVFNLLGNYAANAAKYRRFKFLEGRAAEAHDILLKRAHSLFSAYVRVLKDSTEPNFETIVAYAYALANVTALRHPRITELYPNVQEMTTVLHQLIRTEGCEDLGETLHQFVTLTCKAISNVSYVCGTRDSLEFGMMMAIHESIKLAQTLPQNPPPDVTIYSLLALHNFMRNSPDRKQFLHGMDVTITVRSILQKARTEKGPLKDLLHIVLWELVGNNPFTDPKDARLQSFIKELRIVKPKRSLKDVAVALGVPTGDGVTV